MSLEESAEKSVKVKRLLDDVQKHLEDTPDAQVIVHSELIKGGIDVLEAGLKARGIGYGKFIGKGNAGVSESARQNDVNDYNAGKKKVLLISSAGGEGLDLPNTTLVASLDGHWNPEKISQVEARGIRLGGLSHRAPKDRKVIVNRYITKLNPSSIDTMRETKRLLDPSELAMRVMHKEKLFFNPHKSMPTVDQLMYAVAKAKAKGNSQMKDLFEKTSEFSVQSDKQILQDYLGKYQNKLLTGDYGDSWVDQADENRYLNRLRRYYQTASRKNVIHVTAAEGDKLKDRTRLNHALRNFGSGALAGAAATTLSMPHLIANPNIPVRVKLLAGGGIAGAAGLIIGGLAARALDKPYVTTPSATAKTRLKFSDEDLRRILRGESISQQKIVTKDHYIKMK